MFPLLEGTDVTLLAPLATLRGNFLGSHAANSPTYKPKSGGLTLELTLSCRAMFNPYEPILDLISVPA